MHRQINFFETRAGADPVLQSMGPTIWQISRRQRFRACRRDPVKNPECRAAG